MTKEEWFAKFLKHRDVLLDLVKVYYPSHHQQHNLKITAPMAEAARLMIPLKELPDIKQLIKDKDVNGLYEVLQDTWFGMPESTEIRNEAFYILCEMLEC